MEGREDLNKGEKIDLKHLEIGEVYKGESIINRSEGKLVNMITVEKIASEIGHKQIDINRYFVKSTSGKVISIKWNGYQEYFPEDEEYEKLNQQIK